MLNQMGEDRTFFMRLRHRLDHIMISCTGLMVPIIVFLLMCISIPLLAKNQYIVTPLLLNLFQAICGFILYNSKRKIYQDVPSVKSTTDDAQEVSKKGQDSVSHSTSHGAPLEALPYRAHHHHPASTLLPGSHTGSPRHLNNKSLEGTPVTSNDNNRRLDRDREESAISASEVSRLDVSITGAPAVSGSGTGNQTPSHFNQREESKDFSGIEITVSPSRRTVSKKIL